MPEPNTVKRKRPMKEFDMRVLKSATAAVMAVAMVAVPMAAQAAQAGRTGASQSKAVERLSVRTKKQSELRGGSIVIAVLAAAAVVGGIVIAADGKNSPTSP
jgi:hypothetical protein